MNQLLSVAFDGVVYSSWLFLMAAGLTLIYGVMRILNIAHGSFYAIGAYASAALVGGSSLRYGVAASYLLLALAAVLVGVILGPPIERGLLKRMYGKDEVILLLVTYAVFLILEDVIKLIWGVESKMVPERGARQLPDRRAHLPGVQLAVDCGGHRHRARVGVGAVSHAAGKASADSHDREISAAMGIDVGRVYLATFTIGTALAALGGALTAPMVAVSPGLGVEVIVLSFAVVVIGGLGSLGGAALGALLVGLVRAAAVRYWPEVELFTIYAVMALVLIVRPRGLFAAPEARKI